MVEVVKDGVEYARVTPVVLMGSSVFDELIIRAIGVVRFDPFQPRVVGCVHKCLSPGGRIQYVSKLDSQSTV